VPLYEYECKKCHHRFELIEKFDAPEHRKCPKCGARADRRIARSAIQFKGSGWYVTDYAKSGSSGSSSDNSDKGSKSEEPGKSEKSEKKETKAEKPAAKESSKPAKKS
jgi:putative FmdB family regulatory protein